MLFQLILIYADYSDEKYDYECFFMKKKYFILKKLKKSFFPKDYRGYNSSLKNIQKNWENRKKLHYRSLLK